MRNFRKIFTISLLSFITIILVSCKPYEAITIEKPGNIKIQSATLKNMTLKVNLPIHNPNFYPVKVNKIRAHAMINGNKVGDVTNRKVIKIPANSEKTHEIDLDVDYSKIFDSGFSFFNLLKQENLQLELNGTLFVQSFLMKKEIDFKQSKEIEINR